MFLRILTASILTLIAGGCVTTSQINRANTDVDLFWQAENEKFMKREGSRNYHIAPNQTFIAAGTALVRMGMIVEKEDPSTGYLLASSPAPLPLTSAEWEKVKRADTPAVHDLLYREFGILAYAKELDPSYKDVLLNVLIAPKASGSSVALSFRLVNKKLEGPDGGKLRTQVPPAAVRIGVGKFWSMLESEVNLAWQPRERNLSQSKPILPRTQDMPKRTPSPLKIAPNPPELSARTLSTRKKTCTSLAGHVARSMGEVKRTLQDEAKKLALSEFFGEVISSYSKLRNFSLDISELSSKSFGIVHIKGSPKYFNGSSLGEICIEGDFFITQADIQRLSPKTVSQNNICYSNESLSYQGLGNGLRDRAITVLATKTSPMLRLASARELATLVKNFKLANERYFVATSSLCADASADIIPLEIDAYAQQRANAS